MVIKLSKTSCPPPHRVRSDRALLASWGARAVYWGSGLQLPAHRNAVAVLALALQAPMRVALDPRNLEKGFTPCRSVLIEPSQLHLIEMTTHTHAFIYLDALSLDLTALRARCSQQGKTWSFHLENEAEVIELLAHLPRTAQAWTGVQASLAKSLGFVQRRADPRMTSVIQALLLSPDDARHADDWANDVGLSSSRFQHVFKQTVGVPFRRFRLWARMRIALACAMRGSTLTEAAMEAGLSSSTHLSAAFKAMFGIAPSQLIGASPVYVDG